MNDISEELILEKSSENDAISDSVFETFWVMDNGCVFLLDEHLERMKKSVENLDLGPLPDTDKLGQNIRNLAKKPDCRNKILRIRYSPAKPSLSRCAYEMRDPVRHDEANGYKIVLSDVRRNPKSYLVYHKTNNYLENRIALKKAINHHYDDALFLNTDGYLAETTKANIFLVKHGKIYTPPIECGILPGIVRAWTIRHAIRKNIDVLQLHLEIDDISQAQEIFVTNSVVGICRVGRVDWEGRTLFTSPKDTPITHMLMEAYQMESASVEY